MKVIFKNSSGQDLAGSLELPNTTPQAFALFAHCFTCSKDIAAASRISQELCAQGFGVLRFDFTGLGHSGGEFENTNFSSNVQDLLSAADYLRQNYQAPQLLVGHSLGGAAVLAAGTEINEVKAIATIGAPADPLHVKHLFEKDLDKIQQDGSAEVNLAGRKFTIKKQFVDDISEQNLAPKIKSMGKALLIFHSPIDNYVSVDNARKIYEMAKHPKSFVSLDQADHLLTKKADAHYVAVTLGAWASRYLDLQPSEAAGGPEGHVVVSEIDGKFYQLVQAGKHTLNADEPTSVGGTDKAPTPYDFLLAGLGACTSMTVRMYANHKKLPLKHVSVKMKHDKIHAKDCEDCETQVGKIDQIVRELTIEGDLTDEQRQKLLEIADKCPVHRTLHSEVKVRTSLVGSN